ncbi:unnamed protein product [Angiostrongylus costaricensis]|uniref:guanylate cyclase n=1 Tax=Angiostrongylus costaricensis TaxID=334426 RepID=A0A158PMJ3_ANGCS|nr:unnamed protein product [Angiostrongylus costaricensis]
MQKAGLAPDAEIDVQTYYDDTDTMRIFRSAADILGISVDDMWEMYGEFLITYACETGWEKMLFCMANNLQEFLDSLNSMHYFIDQIAFKSEMRGPTFQCESVGDGSLRLHYFSHRQGLFPIVKGLVRQTAHVLFDINVVINFVERSQERRKGGLVEHVVFCVEPDEEHRPGKRLAHKFKRDTRALSSLAVNLSDFSRIFPYHICFNRQMIVEHVGGQLLMENDLSCKKMVKLTELVQLIQPADIQLTHKNIMSYLNTLFIVQLKHHSKRSEVGKESSKAFHQPLCLKGQMISINEGNSIMFLCSPHATTIRDILNLNLFISDMPIHDATRDLIMLNQSRMSQIELNKRLEETVKSLKSLAEELKSKKQQTEHLLYEFVPPMIADALRLGSPVPAQEYGDCTVMVTDIPDFYTITGCCKPSKIIDIFATLFKQFDHLIDKHECYKVLSLMDSYLVVSGAPKSNELHAESILNLAIGVVFSGHQVIVPDTKYLLQVRVGISSGSIVAGVVSYNKPRYCVFGQTVNVAKQTCALSQPGKILVTNLARTMVEEHQRSAFVFEQHQFLEYGAMKIQTYILVKNERKSVWEIADAIKGADQSIDGYKELHNNEGAAIWEKTRIDVIDTLRFRPSRTQRTLTRLQSMKRKFGAPQNNDICVSISEPNEDSVVCNIM